MADTSARTLRLLSLLESRRYWPGAELAGRLQVSARTLRRDVDRLRELGYPIQAQRGVDGGYQLAAGTALPPLVVQSLDVHVDSASLRSRSTVGVFPVDKSPADPLVARIENLSLSLQDVYSRTDGLGSAAG